MKALVYHGQGKESWDEDPDPKLTPPTDAIVPVEPTPTPSPPLPHPNGPPTSTAPTSQGHVIVPSV